MPDATPERWLPIPGYEGLYEASDHGRIRGLDRIDSRGRRTRGVILKQQVNARSAYPQVGLYRSGKVARRTVHSLVLETFAGQRPDGYEARHLDGGRQHGELSNLVWGTASENSYDKVRHGTDHNTSKTHCPQGHEYTSENTYANGRDGYTVRKCKACTRIHDAAWRQRNPERAREMARLRAARYRARKRTEGQQVGSSDGDIN